MKAIFLDRDGTLNEDTGYTHKIKDFKMCKNAEKGLKLLKDYLLIVISNQSGVSRGYFTLNEMEEFNSHMVDYLNKQNIKIKKVYCCPHKRQDHCQCRKPSPQFILEAKKKYNLKLSDCWMIGDNITDLMTAKNAGCRSILVLTGKGQKFAHLVREPVANDLLHAAKMITQ